MPKEVYPGIQTIVIVVGLFFCFYKKKFPDLVILCKFSALNGIYGFFTLLLLFIFSDILPRFLILRDFASATDISRLNFIKFSIPGLTTFITIAIVIPITEEIFTRGVLLRLFLEYYSLPLAIIFNGVVFALGHVVPGSYLGFVIMKVFFWGVLLSSITYKTKNLSFAFGFHIANNFLAFLIS